MEVDREMDAVAIEESEKETATEVTEATTEIVGIQATQTATPEEDINSDHGGAISPPEIS